ncbi:MAG TPA: hypothetical protein VF112_07520, partial [Candidatus Dormibacteraeota bacterium]
APAPARHGWRRSALAAASPLLLGGAAVGAVATSTAGETSAASVPAPPHLSPAATPCPTPRMVPRESTPQVSVPSVLLANHQPCNHHEGMVTAFRWL